MSDDQLTNDKKAFTHFVDNVLQLPLSSDVRAYFAEQRIDCMTRFIHVSDYDDFYRNINEEPTALSELNPAARSIIKRIFAACYLWREVEHPHYRDRYSVPPPDYWMDADKWTHESWRTFCFGSREIVDRLNCEARRNAFFRYYPDLPSRPVSSMPAKPHVEQPDGQDTNVQTGEHVSMVSPHDSSAKVSQPASCDHPSMLLSKDVVDGVHSELHGMQPNLFAKDPPVEVDSKVVSQMNVVVELKDDGEQSNHSFAPTPQLIHGSFGNVHLSCVPSINGRIYQACFSPMPLPPSLVDRGPNHASIVNDLQAKGHTHHQLAISSSAGPNLSGPNSMAIRIFGDFVCMWAMSFLSSIGIHEKRNFSLPSIQHAASDFLLHDKSVTYWDSTASSRSPTLSTCLNGSTTPFISGS